MTNIREEIETTIMCARGPLDTHDYVFWTDEIIKLFEKLIDEKIKYAENSWNGDEEFWDGVNMFYNELKDELTGKEKW